MHEMHQEILMTHKGKELLDRTLLRPTRLLEYELKNILSQQLAPLLNSSVMPAN